LVKDAKPEYEIVTVYLPARKFVMLYWPWSSETLEYPLG
jgi:hypothetical protein